MNSYVALVLAIVLEVIGTSLLPLSAGFSRIGPTLALSLCYIGAFYLLSIAVVTLPLAVVYASWSGLGIFLVAVIGLVAYGQTLNWTGVLGLMLIVSGVILLNGFGGVGASH